MRLVAERLVRFRTQRGLSLEEAATDAVIDPDRLAAAEAGERALADIELERLGAAYGVEVPQLFGGEITPVEYLLGLG